MIFDNTFAFNQYQAVGDELLHSAASEVDFWVRSKEAIQSLGLYINRDLELQ